MKKNSAPWSGWSKTTYETNFYRDVSGKVRNLLFVKNVSREENEFLT